MEGEGEKRLKKQTNIQSPRKMNCNVDPLLIDKLIFHAFRKNRNNKYEVEYLQALSTAVHGPAAVMICVCNYSESE